MWEIKSALSVVTNAQGRFCSCAKNLFLKMEVGLYKVIYGEFVVVNTHWTAANTLSPICVIVQPFLASFSPTNEGRESGVSLAEQWNSVKQNNNKIRTTCAHVHIVITIFILFHTMLSVFSVEQMLEAASGGSYKILIKADRHTLQMLCSIPVVTNVMLAVLTPCEYGLKLWWVIKIPPVKVEVWLGILGVFVSSCQNIKWSN